MDLWEAIQSRHSVREYNTRPVEPEVLNELQAMADQFNAEADLHIQLIRDQPEAFQSLMAKFRHFKNVRHYFAMVAKEDPESQERLGYYGEKLVLRARQLGLGTCWVAATYNKGKCISNIHPGEKRHAVISLGYAEDMGHPRSTKSIEELSHSDAPMSEWFRKGMEAAQLAPTGMNRQNFRFTLDGDRVRAQAGHGLSAAMDLGIVKCHFEIGAQDGAWSWME